jgi:hypothetical protein
MPQVYTPYQVLILSPSSLSTTSVGEDTADIVSNWGLLVLQNSGWIVTSLVNSGIGRQSNEISGVSNDAECPLSLVSLPLTPIDACVGSESLAPRRDPWTTVVGARPYCVGGAPE